MVKVYECLPAAQRGRWLLPLSGAGADHGGRFNPRGADALYLGLAKDGGTSVVGRPLRALLRLGTDDCIEAGNLAAPHLTDVRTRIADLKAMERVPSDTLGLCDAGASAASPLIEVLTRINADGSDCRSWVVPA